MIWLLSQVFLFSSLSYAKKMSTSWQIRLKQKSGFLKNLFGSLLNFLIFHCLQVSSKKKKEEKMRILLVLRIIS